jgi:hypothetical protein
LLQVEGQEYQIILGLAKLDALFSPTSSFLSLTQASANPTGNSHSKTSFTIDFFIEEQTLLNNIKINYMLLGAQLKAKLLMMGQPVNINLGAGRCDGLTAPNTTEPPFFLCHYKPGCKQVQSVPLNYRLFFVQRFNYDCQSIYINDDSIKIGNEVDIICVESCECADSGSQLRSSELRIANFLCNCGPP